MNKQELVQQYAPLVKRIANYMLHKVPPLLARDDLIQAGMIGLLEAAGRYRDDKGASFKTFASIRIKGAMLDEVRRYDWFPRTAEKRQQKMCHLEDLPVSETSVLDDTTEPVRQVEQEDFLKVLQKAMSMLPEKEQMVLSFYCVDECSLKQIGLRLGVTESRACQIYHQAVHGIQAQIAA